MKKRILFVDDEPNLLMGLQRSLRQRRDQWETEFFDDSRKALARVGEQPFDAVVSDLHMPGLSGVDLLNHVMKHYPRTVRIILSGTADRDSILACVGFTHQFLLKPCRLEELTAILSNAFVLQDSFQSERLKSVIAQMAQLPSMPSLCQEIMAATNEPDSSLDKIVRLIARDPALTSTVLKLANSAFFGLRRQVGGPEEAAAYLGLEMIKSLTLSAQAFSSFKQPSLANFSVETLWAHSQKVAARAKAISQDVDPGLASQAVTAGMLHDIGKLVLATNFPDDYSRVIAQAQREDIELHVVEEQFFGVSHADVGSYLLGLWGLPAFIVEAIALHHHPGQSAQPSFNSLAAVHLAEVFEEVQATNEGGMAVAKLDRNYLAAIGASDRLASWEKLELPPSEQAVVTRA